MPFRLIPVCLLLLVIQGVGEIWGQEEGFASYYHERFHGRMSSSGRIHNKEELVAAHRTYPFGTFLRVTNLKNMKATVVCITDRGPRSKQRIIDLSHSAAEELDFIKNGIARVRIEEVPNPRDMQYLDLIYPQMPYINTEHFEVKPPYKVKIRKR